jgi:hypothetical protein
VSGFIKSVTHLPHMFRRTQLETIFEEEWFDPYLDLVIARVQIVWTQIAFPCLWARNDL